MKAISQPSTSTKTHKFATLTALAAACTMMLSAPAIAADTDTATTAPAMTSVPSAVDSSTRVIRRAQPNATVSPAQTDAQSNTAISSAIQQSNVQQSSTQKSNMQFNTAQAQVPSTAQPEATIPVADTSELTGSTRVYQRGPMTSSGMDISGGQLPSVPSPQVRVSDISFVPTVLIPQQQNLGTDKLDVSLLDDFIAEVSPNARHYPPNFPNRTERYNTREKIKVLTEWIEPYASAPNASFDVLIRAAKLNGMGRNLDLGSDYTIRGGQYVDRAIKNKPDSGEANFIYGMMLAEGGGFKEGQKYLDRAVALGYTEAEQSLAQSDVLSDRRDKALERLRRLEQQMPNNTVIRQHIKLVEEGSFYIWDLPASTMKTQATI